ncbi:RNB domain-containing ribonuclease [Allocatelliglobosispora scoriae]|uniref:RNB domain-containing ribonuclease n=1 Tax=Allocatelliglobosispora scoriae TaxID=643052 RepID=UPI00161C4986|nr:RNB domain-containing ribonuclease [Allocatelliglobosispora scoriae]
MVTRRVLAPAIDFGPLRRELRLPEQFSPAAQREADEAAKLPLPKLDRTDLPFVTIDPAGSMDLDQAVLLLARPGGGFRVHYAIADVAAFVRPGGPLEADTWQRGQTVYLPDGNVPLHPTTLSEGAVSLLPDQERAAVVWTIDLGADGATTAVHVERARVRSRAKLSYVGVQADVDAGKVHDSIALLPTIGPLLVARGLARGAISLPSPEQEVEPDGDGWQLVLRAPVPVEEWNAQISLLTGVSAARIMLDGGIGLLRTMPYPAAEAVEELRKAAVGLGIAWPQGATVGQVIAALDPGTPQGAAFVDQAQETMRGAGYTAFDGAPPEQPDHGGVASSYAHVTAPLRRLADRYATEAALALYEGREVPPWCREALPKLPEVMAETGRAVSAAERGAVDLTEAVLLHDRIGEVFDAVILDEGQIAIDAPPVRARCTGAKAIGERVQVRLTEADPLKRTVRFEVVAA